MMLARKIERLDSVARAYGLVTMGFQQVVKELHIELVVFHDHDSFGHSPAFPAVAAARNARSGENGPWFAEKIMRQATKYRAIGCKTGTQFADRALETDAWPTRAPSPMVPSS
jgi:hypothetical protein